MLKPLNNVTPFQHSYRSAKFASSSQICAASLGPSPRSDRKPVNEVQEVSSEISRRLMLQSLAVGTLSQAPLIARPSEAVQGLTAGRIPGLSSPDAEGYATYTRPEGKSGGHGVGWSEIPKYSFKVPEGWAETPVSIADLGGTEIDLRFSSRDQGSLAVVVAPVLRFIDVGFNADVRIEEIGPPDRLISGFAPELFGGPLQDDDVIKTEVTRKGPLTYYCWQLKPHRLVVATAYKNRTFLLAIQANGRQWRKAEKDLRHVQESFQVVTA